MLEDEVLDYLLNSKPSDTDLANFDGVSTTTSTIRCYHCTMTGVTRSNTYMDMGMYAVGDYYFFYTKFVPP